MEIAAGPAVNVARRRIAGLDITAGTGTAIAIAVNLVLNAKIVHVVTRRTVKPVRKLAAVSNAAREVF